MNIRSPLDLGLIIRQRRRDLGLNQTELASRVGVGRQWIVAIEHGKARAELGLVLRTLAALNLTLDVDTVLSTIVTKAVELSGTDAGAIYVYDEARGEFDLKATHMMPEEMIKAVSERRIRVGETAVGRAASTRAPVQTSDGWTCMTPRSSQRWLPPPILPTASTSTSSTTRMP